MSWNLIADIRKSNKVDSRLVRPYGLALSLGDVVRVQKNGNLSLEGSCRSLLGIMPTPPREGTPGNLLVQSAEGTSIAFKAAGVGSSLYPELPKANACFDIEFADAQSWLLACTGRTIYTLTEQNRFREPILDAYDRGVWQADWALVVEICIVERLTLLAATSKKTSVTLSLGAQVASTAAMEAKLTADVTVAKTSSALEQWITYQPSTAFCNAMRVKDGWLTAPGIGTLQKKDKAVSFTEAPDDEAWQSILMD